MSRKENAIPTRVRALLSNHSLLIDKKKPHGKPQGFVITMKLLG
jgi:hypothetical protein